MKTATKFFKRAAKWYFRKAAEIYSWTPDDSVPLNKIK